MNNIPPTPPILPNPDPSASPPASVPQIGSADDQTPITSVHAAIEAILRQPRRVMLQLRQPNAKTVIDDLLLIAIGSALVYGLVVGTFSGGDQLWAAPVKIAGGLLLSAVICLPSLYIFACLSGSPARLGEVVGFVAGLLALTTVLLIGFAPVAWIFSQSTESVAAMGALHLIFWSVAVAFGLRFLHAAFEQLRSSSGSNAVGLWMVIFLLVTAQMSTALRPLVGTAPGFVPQEKKFFLAHWLDSLKPSDATRTKTPHTN